MNPLMTKTLGNFKTKYFKYDISEKTRKSVAKNLHRFIRGNYRQFNCLTSEKQWEIILTATGNNCGNGLKEDGEECDSKTKCCTPSCKFSPIANCDLGPCCDNFSCQLLVKGSNCRFDNQNNYCMKCTGNSEQCKLNICKLNQVGYQNYSANSSIYSSNNFSITFPLFFIYFLNTISYLIEK